MYHDVIIYRKQKSGTLTNEFRRKCVLRIWAYTINTESLLWVWHFNFKDNFILRGPRSLYTK